MLTRQLSLDFACCACARPVGVTLKCEGDGLKALKPTASVNLRCPNCGTALLIDFCLDGTVLDVSRDRTPLRMPQQCHN